MAQQHTPEKTYKVVKTAFVYAAFVTFGISCSLMGPAIPDLLDQLGITEEDMGLASSIDSLVKTAIGMVIGPVIARFQSKVDIILGISFLHVACAMWLIPNTQYYWVFVPSIIVQSLGFTGIDQASNLIILNLWGTDNAPLQGLHTCWSLGWSIGPFIIRPYLGPDTHLLSENESVSTEDILPENHTSRIHIAYAIVSGLVILSSIGCFVSYVKGIPKGTVLHLKPVESCKTMFRCQKCERSSRFTIFILFCFCLYYFLNACEDNFVSMWLVTYAVKSDMKFSKKDATLLDAASKFSHLIGRILSSLIALKVKVQVITFIAVYGVLGSLIGLAFLGSIYHSCLWVFTCLFMAFCAPKWPCGIAWTNVYVNVKGTNYILINLGAGMGWMVISWFNGWLFTNRSPNDAIKVPIYIGALLCLELVIMQIVASHHGPKKKSEDEVGEELEQLVASSGESDSDVISQS